MNNGPWVMIRDWANDFQNVPVSEIGGWSSEFCVTWAWNYDPDVPNDNTTPHWLESKLDQAPVLSPPASPIAYALNFNETIKVDANSCQVFAQPKGVFIAMVFTDSIAVSKDSNLNSVLAQRVGLFVTVPDGLEQIAVSGHYDSASVIGGIRG